MTEPRLLLLWIVAATLAIATANAGPSVSRSAVPIERLTAESEFLMTRTSDRIHVIAGERYEAYGIIQDGDQSYTAVAAIGDHGHELRKFAILIRPDGVVTGRVYLPYAPRVVEMKIDPPGLVPRFLRQSETP